MRQRISRLRTAAADEDGSVLLLALGYAVLALATVLVCVDATSLYLEQKRLDALADAAALAGADGFVLDVVDGSPAARLSSDGVRAQAEVLLAVADADADLVRADAPDGVSARVTVADTWHPPVFSLFVPDGVELQATATSRTALR
ncbi:pilus assembly protein TadG-related protein [Microbacterium sp. SLBN-146]|uniref:pilus assembly protein TadG-related protein n=1 Tax=Microbacterium sp. SLBN-146 TaxID=2768457 RepID=UPI0011540329|nr:pilus assembly protein TadG-related protein [Microbacterium sp. SLBN-146]TQJ31818.1 putative Flp pilus-assembly TadE/G-like protein [Microbacterium sp. SLBN-146]